MSDMSVVQILYDYTTVLLMNDASCEFSWSRDENAASVLEIKGFAHLQHAAARRLIFIL